MASVTEQRGHARLDIALSVSFVVQRPGGEISERAESISSDISASGIRLMSPKVLEKGSILSLEIQLPDDHAEPILAEGEVVWQNKISEFSYETGAVLTHMQDQDKKRFMGFVFDQLSRFVGAAPAEDSRRSLH